MSSYRVKQRVNLDALASHGRVCAMRRRQNRFVVPLVISSGMKRVASKSLDRRFEHEVFCCYCTRCWRALPQRFRPLYVGKCAQKIRADEVGTDEFSSIIVNGNKTEPYKFVRKQSNGNSPVRPLKPFETRMALPYY